MCISRSGHLMHFFQWSCLQGCNFSNIKEKFFSFSLFDVSSSMDSTSSIYYAWNSTFVGLKIFFFLTEKTKNTEKTQRQLFIMRHPFFPDYAWKFMFIDLQSFFLTGKMENAFPRDEHVKSMIIVQGQLNVLGFKTTTLGEAFSYIKMLIEK